MLNFQADGVKTSHKFYKKARSHMISYHILDNQHPESPNSYQLIEKIRKFYAQSKKCHRSIDDSEHNNFNSLIEKRSELWS